MKARNPLLPVILGLITTGGLAGPSIAHADAWGTEPENSRAVRDAKERLCADWDQNPRTITCTGEDGFLNRNFAGVRPTDRNHVSRVKALMETTGYSKEKCEKAVEAIWVAKHYVRESDEMRANEIHRTRQLEAKIGTTSDNMRQVGAEIKNEADTLERRRRFFKSQQEKALSKLSDGYEYAAGAKSNAQGVFTDMNQITESYATSYCQKSEVLAKYRNRMSKVEAMLDEAKQASRDLRRQITDSEGYLQTFARLKQQGAQIEQSGQAIATGDPARNPDDPAAAAVVLARDDRRDAVTGGPQDDRFYNTGSKEERAERVSRLDQTVTGMSQADVQAALLNPRSPASAQLLEKANTWAQQNGITPPPKVSATDNVCGERCVAVLRLMQLQRDNSPRYDAYRTAYPSIQAARLQDMHLEYY